MRWYFYQISISATFSIRFFFLLIHNGCYRHVLLLYVWHGENVFSCQDNKKERKIIQLKKVISCIWCWQFYVCTVDPFRLDQYMQLNIWTLFVDQHFWPMFKCLWVCTPTHTLFTSEWFPFLLILFNIVYDTDKEKEKKI